MMADWNGYRQQLVETIGKIAQLSPDSVRGYSVLGAAGSKTKHLDPKIRELIALAVAVTLRCDGCITVHTDAAIKQGASQEYSVLLPFIKDGFEDGHKAVHIVNAHQRSEHMQRLVAAGIADLMRTIPCEYCFVANLIHSAT